jgi:hypothetical protein
MHERILTPATQSALGRLAEYATRKKFYLAGGTGCALHLGHRISEDLDFFSPVEFSPSTLWADLRGLADCVPDYTDAGTWVGAFEGTKTGFFRYPYPLVGELVSCLGVSVASLEDIGCMKIEAIVGQGKKRDFVDLYYILREMGFDLSGMLRLFRRKYKFVSENRIHILKSLAYFPDADADPEPRMLVDCSWTEIKRKLAVLVEDLPLE